MRERECIDNFADYIGTVIENSIQKDIDFNELSRYKNILLFGTVNQVYVREFLQRLFNVNTDVKVFMIGQESMDALSRDFPGHSIKLHLRSGRYTAADIQAASRIWELEAMEAAVYFNNYVHSVDYCNIEEMLTFLDQEIFLYSYSVLGKELNYVKDVEKHYKGLILYHDLVEMFSRGES